MRELASAFLKELGHDVETCVDGHAAQAAIVARCPDLVVTEILVPRLDGLSLCRQLKASPETRHVQVLVLSILAAVSRAEEAGADGFLLKPLSQYRLIAMVQELFTQRSVQAPEHP